MFDGSLFFLDQNQSRQKVPFFLAERYNKQHSTLSFVIGESVSVRIPRIDRASSDLSRLPCVVVEIVRGDQSLSAWVQVALVISLRGLAGETIHYCE